MSDEARVLSERDGAVLTLTINRPKALNALDAATIQALAEAVGGVAATPDIRCVVLTGAGEKAFVAGADIAAMASLNSWEARSFSALGHALGDALEALPVPVIAAVNGFALGGGCELALACDFIYASRAARFGQPEVNLGLIPGFGGTQRLPRRIGVARARELVFTGELIGAEEALRIGLVNKLCEPGELLPKARAAAAVIAAKPPLAIAEAKRALRRSEELPLSAGNQLEQQLFAGLFATADRREGMQAFLEKRPAKFQGR
ncbi:MAG TPA: enoyl-CoA hydratase-related protein [Polyangia bacterium]|nr:enoyl-CoA hydratase-related protein [Polyangia bacterium]